MQRFYVTFPLSIDMSITDTDIIHQLTRVMRIQMCEHIVLFSWDGTETEYEIVSIEKKSIRIKWITQKTPKTESAKKVSLYQALPNKYEKIEYILQKWVEIGITRFVFFRSERSQKLILSPAKVERFVSIAREALEQCGGVILPEIAFLDSFPVSWFDGESSIVLDTVWENRRLVSYDSLQNIALWVWPEGGWSDGERSKMIDNWFIFARFGDRVLRTETAGIVIGFGFMNA
jgi:16S rRNA (uracil1498-N3)-methyltransferase